VPRFAPTVRDVEYKPSSAVELFVCDVADISSDSSSSSSSFSFPPAVIVIAFAPNLRA
jgi:hypothetical protein